MATPRERLRELGLELPGVVAPLAAYVPAVRTGSLVYTSGQVPMIDGKLGWTGVVGADVTLDEATEAARTCALNALAAIDDLVGLDAVEAVVKVVGFVASTPEFTDQPKVINGASHLLGEVFGSPHARSAVGVAALPLGAPVEVELIVSLR